jgi:hypothetical protein
MTNRVFMGLFGSVGPTRPRVQSWAHLGFENNNFPNMHKIIILYIYILSDISFTCLLWKFTCTWSIHFSIFLWGIVWLLICGFDVIKTGCEYNSSVFLMNFAWKVELMRIFEFILGPITIDAFVAYLMSSWHN